MSNHVGWEVGNWKTEGFWFESQLQFPVSKSVDLDRLKQRIHS